MTVDPATCNHQSTRIAFTAEDGSGGAWCDRCGTLYEISLYQTIGAVL